MKMVVLLFSEKEHRMYFRVKFYAIDPSVLQDNTRYQFFLQLKNDIASERCVVPAVCCLLCVHAYLCVCLCVCVCVCPCVLCVLCVCVCVHVHRGDYRKRRKFGVTKVWRTW